MSHPLAFGRYIVINPLPSGGMADLYLAHDPKLNRRVAVKVPQVARLTRTGRMRFEREARAVAGLADCPEIVTLYDFGEQDNAPYLVMRYMPGGTLAERIKRGAFSLEQTLPIIERVAAALDFAHRRDIVHRDVKPANILFDSAAGDNAAGGNAFLSDFGIAIAPAGNKGDSEMTEVRLTEAGSSSGTQGYRSPEQALGEDDLDGRSDIYSLGIVLFEMLAGKVPAQAQLPLIAKERQDLPAAAQQLFDRALAKDREARYAAASELAADLRALVAGGRLRAAPVIPVAIDAPPPATPPPMTPETVEPPKRPVFRLWLPAAVAVIALGVALFSLVRGNGDPPPAPTPTVEIVVVPATAEPATAEPTTEPTTAPTAEPTAEPTTEPTSTAEPPTPTPTPLSRDPIPLSGDGLMQLTFADAAHSSNYTAIFSPDQTYILLSVAMGDDWQVWEADPSGGGLRRQITSGPYDYYQADISPDGRTFLTAANLDGDGDIYLFDVATGQMLAQLTDNPGNNYHPRWLPDGERFIFSLDDDGTSHDEVFISTLDGRQTQLTDNNSFDGFAVPSRDGRYVTFYSGRDGDYEIYVMDIDGGNQRRLTTSPGRDASPSFTPDGHWIVFESERGGRYEIYATPFEGGQVVRLTDAPGDTWVPVVSPDGLWLMYQSTRGGEMDIYRQPLELP